MWLLGHVAKTLAIANGDAVDRFAVEEDLTVSGSDESRDHVQGGGFAGSVGAKVSGDFSRMNGETDVVNGGNTGVQLANVTKFEHGAEL